MSQPPVSVIVVSRGRPKALRLCLTGLSQVVYSSFEIIVVADPGGEAAVQDLSFGSQIKTALFDLPNISAARNIGLAAASGEIVAFIDDDAVPEPRWLEHLVAPFENPEVASVGGFVRGRNGISFQWKARAVDGAANHVDLVVDETHPSIPDLPAGFALKTEGTNMAFRREILASYGGFDTDFAFFLDETDVNLRLHRAGYKAAISPLAQVHHAYAESDRRGADRSVRDLTGLGRSLAVFLGKHCAEDQRVARWAAFYEEQRKRVLDQMVRGLLEPRDIGPLLAGLESGFTEGAISLQLGQVDFPATKRAFACFERPRGKSDVVLAGRVWQGAKLRAEAARRVSQGDAVSVFVFSHSMLFHRVRYCLPGYWRQTGGLWGRSARNERIFQAYRFDARVQTEKKRVGKSRFSSGM